MSVRVSSSPRRTHYRKTTERDRIQPSSERNAFERLPRRFVWSSAGDTINEDISIARTPRHRFPTNVDGRRGRARALVSFCNARRKSQISSISYCRFSYILLSLIFSRCVSKTISLRNRVPARIGDFTGVYIRRRRRRPGGYDARRLRNLLRRPLLCSSSRTKRISSVKRVARDEKGDYARAQSSAAAAEWFSLS